ncbi:MAG: hypothetical protein LBU88_08830 [Treponema sp.]|jgi:hypothetical protein|nr:hypothetical protein [Treponema sp.]
MYIRNKSFFSIMLSIVFALYSCSPSNYSAEISDLNGTWQPNWSYRAAMKLSEEEINYFIFSFSWGEGLTLFHTTFEIDTTAEEPFISEPGLGYFPITEITQVGASSIKIRAVRGDLTEPAYCWYPEFIFHFIDKDTIWIETDDIDNSDYGKKALWYRLSGPTSPEY